MKKIILSLFIFLLSFIALIFLLSSLLLYHAKKDASEDKIQQEKILNLLNESGVVDNIRLFIRSRDNAYKYNIHLLFKDGMKMSVGDAYLKDSLLYYQHLFRLGNYTSPYRLFYDGRSVSISSGHFENATGSDIVEMYHNKNLSHLLENKDKMLDFLKTFPFVDKETYKKTGSNKDKYSELIEKFNLINCNVLWDDGTERWIKENEKWVVLDADILFAWEE